MPEKHDDYREELAALCHEQWAGWMDYFLSNPSVTTYADGSITVMPGYVAALKALVATPYAELPEAQKDNDRKEADRILALR